MADTVADDFADELSTHLARYGDRPFIEFERRWYSGDEVTQVIDAVIRLLDDNAVPSTAPIGL
ncbi:long-chain fatty acid--CoA ligase, partial [Streptomyces sp. SID10244]|nr:long-chain fatty acid--CoA ligase [Streptomyces sp. SID10244]